MKHPQNRDWNGQTKHKSIVLTHRVMITGYPEAGSACVRKGQLVFITSGHYEIGGRISNHFSWRPIKEDGTLGRKTSGYWDRKWSPQYPQIKL